MITRRLITTLLPLCAAALHSAHGQAKNPNFASPNFAWEPSSNSNAAEPIYVVGRVVTDDGSVLPLGVLIERVCGGGAHRLGYAQTNGNFGVYLNDDSQIVQDASASHENDLFSGRKQTGTDSFQGLILQNCELTAQYPGFVSTRLPLAGRLPLANPSIGMIVLHRAGPAPEAMVSATTLAAPKGARKAYERGLRQLGKNDQKSAIGSFQAAVAAYPKFAAAWTVLGKIQLGQNDDAGARLSFAHALDADANFVGARLGMCAIDYDASQWPALARDSAEVVRRDPLHYPQAFLLNAIAEMAQSHVELAEDSIKRADRIDISHHFPEIAHTYALILAARGDYAAAADQMAAYLALAPAAADASKSRAQLDGFVRAALPSGVAAAK